MQTEPRLFRAASEQDAPAMAELINHIILTGGTTAHRDPFSPELIVTSFVRSNYHIGCFVALAGERLSGFQSLEWCDPNWPGEDRLPADWAVIATYVALPFRGSGIGRGLFNMTRTAARDAGVRFIDATIRRENALGLAFYDALGFVDYRSGKNTISKRFDPA